MWQHNANITYHPPTTIKIIERSSYIKRYKYNEKKTTSLPTFIRIDDTYFQRKIMHLNNMITGFQLPTLFIILSMTEGSWSYLHDILNKTDNHDIILTNWPLHITLHFIYRLQSLKKLIWKDFILNR